MPSRRKLIQRLAQTATSSPAPVPAVSSGDPTPVDISTFFPSVSLAWGADNLAKLQRIVNAINNAIYILSGKQMDFNRLRVQLFNVDPSKYPDQALAAIVRLAGVVFNSMLTNRTQPWQRALTPQERQPIIVKVRTGLNVSTIPGGAINAYLQTKVGPFKETLNSLLDTVKSITLD